MIIYYRDALGVVAVETDQYGASFDHEKGIALFLDENGNEYTVPIVSMTEIIP